MRFSNGFALLLLGLTACRSPSETDPGSPHPSAPVAAPSTPKPVDRLAKDELLAGTDKAFGLVLPRGTRITSSFVDLVHTSNAVSIRALSAYVAERVADGTSSRGDRGATFEGVRVPTDPTRYLSIRIGLAPDGTTKMEVRDVTPKTAPEGLSEDERWKRVGLRRNGRLDPSRMD